MEDLQQRVTEVEIPGLKWLGEGNLIPTCFGMSKLTIMCQIFDEQVPSTQVIYDALEELEGVGSTREIASQMA
jgi:translation elongation factor EF-1beta